MRSLVTIFGCCVPPGALALTTVAFVLAACEGQRRTRTESPVPSVTKPNAPVTDVTEPPGVDASETAVAQVERLDEWKSKLPGIFAYRFAPVGDVVKATPVCVKSAEQFARYAEFVEMSGRRSQRKLRLKALLAESPEHLHAPVTLELVNTGGDWYGVSSPATPSAHGAYSGFGTVNLPVCSDDQTHTD